MNEIVLLHHLEPMTTSEVIAEGVEMDHASVIKLVRKYVAELQKFGGVGFEIRPFDTKGGIQYREFAWLNEQQATFLITLMRNTPRVVEFKIALVKAFFAMRDRLLEQQAAVPPVMTSQPYHIADLTVSGWRTFRSMLGVARISGMPLAEALRRANAATQRKLGINMLAEIDADDYPDTLAPLAAEEDIGSIASFFRDWLKGETPHPVCACDSAQFYTAYVRWCHRSVEKPRSHNNVSTYVGKQKGWEVRIKSRFLTPDCTGVDKRVRMVLPPQIILEATWREGRDYRKRLHQTEAQWATQGHFAFAASLGE